MHFRTAVLVGLAALAFVGCLTNDSSPAASASLSSIQRGAMQTKELEGDFETAYAATISVLQDLGWQVDAVDRDSGLIQASSVKRYDVIGPEDDYRAEDPIIRKMRSKTSRFKGEKNVSPVIWTRWAQLTAHVEPWGSKTVRERITIVKSGSLPSGTYYYPFPKPFGFKEETVRLAAQEQSAIVDDPQTYQLLFQQIQKAIFVRQGLKKGAK